MRYARLAICALACLIACGDSVSAPEPAQLILNADTKVDATTHWTRTIGGVDIGLGLYADGTGTFRKCGVPTDITWTRLGPASMSITGLNWSCSSNPAFQGNITSFADIEGGLTDGQFTTTAVLNGADVAQTWLLAPGSP